MSKGRKAGVQALPRTRTSLWPPLDPVETGLEARSRAHWELKRSQRETAAILVGLMEQTPVGRVWIDLCVWTLFFFFFFLVQGAPTTSAIATATP